MLDNKNDIARQKLLEQALREKGITFELDAIPKCDEQTVLYPSYAQRRLLFLDQLNSGTKAYNLPIVFPWQGKVNRAAFNETLANIVERHTVLKTQFVPVKEDIQVQLTNQTLPELNVVDLSEQNNQESIRKTLNEIVDVTFDLQSGPLFSANLITLSEEQTVVVMVFHHTVMDGWSTKVFIRDFVELYLAEVESREPELPVLNIQYTDYAMWQRDHLTPQLTDTQLQYWSTQLEGASQQNAIEYDKNFALDTDHQGALVCESIDAGTLSALQSLAEKNNASLFMVLLSAYNVLLHKYSGAQDQIVGIPVWNRNHPDLDNLVGFFVNTLLIRSQFDGDMSFEALLSQVKRNLLDAHENQDVPYEQVIEKLGVERSGTDSPFLHSMLSLQHVEKKEVGAYLQSIDVELPGLSQAKFDLNLELIQSEKGLDIRLEYRSGRYSEELMRQLLSHFTGLIGQLAAESSQPIREIQLLSDEQINVINAQLTGERTQPEQVSVLAAFQSQVKQRPDAIGVSDDSGTLSYAQIDELSTVLAKQLVAKGVASGDVVTIALPRKASMLVSMLAVWKADATYLPLDTLTPNERNFAIIEDAKSRFVIVEDAESTPFVSDGFTLCQYGNHDADEAAVLPQSNVNQSAYVIYTSGSTGTPKGVDVGHAALCNLISWYTKTTEATEKDIFSQLAGAAFDATLLEFWSTLWVGAQLKFVPEETKLNSNALMNWLVDEQVTISFMPTPILEACFKLPLPAGLVLRHLLTGGDALQTPPPKDAPFTLTNMYGPTENACVATSTRIDCDRTGSLPIGMPVDNANLVILDKEGNQVPIGVMGELCIGGASLANGYLHNASQTEAAFICRNDQSEQRVYRSGDMVKLQHNGDLLFKGRNDDQIKIHGHRIELADIRTALYKIQGVQHASVVANALPSGNGHYLTAYYQSDSALSTGFIAGKLAALLPAYMIPSVFVKAEHWPLTDNGKVDHEQLIETYGIGEAFETDRALTETESLIADIWKAILGVETVNLHDNFFRLGGHSLLATQLVAKIKSILNVELALSTLFSSPTLAGMASHVDLRTGLRESSSAPAIEVNERDDENEFPQSFAQQRLWFLEQLEPNTTTYSVPCAYVLEGKVDIDSLRMAFDKLTRKHEILRTSFSIVGDGEFVQRIKPERHCHFSYTNLSELPAAELQANVDRIIRDEANTPFDITEGRVMRVTLITMNDARHFMLINMHHIVTDALSMGIMFEELKALYHAEVSGQASEPEPLAIQYADYSKWQTEWLRFGVLEELLFYWQEKLKDAPPELSLMTDFPKTGNLSARGDSIRFTVDKALTSSLNRVALDNDATLFMVLMSAFNTLLYRYSGQTDIVVGVPVANRNNPELDNLIGLFVNTLVMRNDLSGNPSFDELIGRVRQTALEAYEHQDLPYEKLVDQLGPERRWNRSPLFQVMFAYHNAPASEFELDGLNILPYALETNTAKFDLNMSMFQYEGEIVGQLEFSTDLFKPETIEAMLQHFSQILQHIGHNASDLISHSALLDNKQKQQIQAWSTGSSVPLKEGDVCSWFSEQAQKTPDNLAISDEQRQLTYKALDEESNRFARHMASLGVKSGDVVAVCMPRSVDMLVTFLAAMKNNTAYLPMDMSYPLERNSKIVESSGANWVVQKQGEVADLSYEREDVQTIMYDAGQDQIAQLSAAPIDRNVDPDATAYVIFTSGSTGKPNGIEVDHKALSNLVDWLVSELQYRPDEVASQIAGAAFDASLCEWWPSLMVGGAVHVVPDQVKIDPSQGIEWLNANKITTAFIPTNMLELTFGEEWPEGIALRNVITGGDQLRKAVPDNAPFKVFNIYGPAENACATTCSLVPKRSENNAVPSIGRPIQNVNVYILDENLGLVPTGVVGTLYVSGTSLAKGYHNNSELTESRFFESPFNTEEVLYNTGDQVRFNSEGELDFIGRIDDQVKIRGFRIELAEIYSVLNSFEALKESYVHIRSDIGTTKKIVIYAVKKDGDDTSLTVDSIHQALKKSLPDYMLPRAIVFMDELPKNSSGKVDRSSLPRPQNMLSEKTYVFIEPRNDVEKSLARIWGNLLEYSPVSVNHNFFEQGGHSLLAMSLKSEIRREFNVDLQMLKLFESATVEDIATHVQDMLNRGIEAKEVLNDFWSYEFEEEETGLLARLKGAFSKAVGSSDKSKLPDSVLKQAVTSLVPLKNNGSEDPLFIVHPNGGMVHHYTELANHMPKDVPVFGVQALSDVMASHNSVTEMAEVYTTAIRSVQPKGPYRLSGWSLGGVIALEIAQQLRSAGEEVSMLTLIDSFLYDSASDEDPRLDLVRFVHEVTGYNGETEPSWLQEEDMENDVDELIVKAKAYLVSRGLFDAQTVDEAFAKRWETFQLFASSWKDYEATSYDDKLHLLMASQGYVNSQKSPLQAWNGVAKNGVTIDVFSGDHYSIMSGDSLRQMADKLTHYLTASQQ